jgi:hypothetical protein
MAREDGQVAVSVFEYWVDISNEIDGGEPELVIPVEFGKEN